MNLPPEKRGKGKSSTINTLKYALRCVKQVKGERRPAKPPLPFVFTRTKARAGELDALLNSSDATLSFARQPTRNTTRC